jgi:tetratricopeptide (TPR) repeat protein
MSQADLSQAPLTEPSEREWELLSNTIDFANAFWIIFLFPNDRYPANIILHRIRRIEQDPPLHLVELTFDQPEDLRELLPRVLAAPPDALLWCFAMAHETPEWRRAWVYYSQRWNEHREVLRRARTGGLLLVASPWVKPLMQSMAPDLWSIRTLSLDPTAPAPISAPQETLQPLVILEPKSLPQPPVSDSRRALALQQAQRALSQPDDPPLDAFLRLGASLQPLMDAQAWDTLLQVAQRAHAAYRQHTASDPTRAYDAPFAVEVAADLNSLGIVWAELGAPEEALEAAQEAVQRYRELAMHNPSLFSSELAGSLFNLGLVLSALHKKEESLSAVQEAAAMYRAVASHRPNTFSPNLAKCLNALGSDLYALGRKEEALEAMAEAVQLRRELARQQPDAFALDLAMSLENLGRVFFFVGRAEEALEATREAVQLRRWLAIQRPEVLLNGLANSLNNLGLVLSSLGKREEALSAAREAVGLYVSLGRRGLAFSRESFGAILGGLVKRLEEAGVDPGTDEVFLEGERVRLGLNLGEGSG